MNELDKAISSKCETCKQVDSTPSTMVSKSGKNCDAQYSAVANCMMKENGKISSCKREWEIFRQCFNE
jgi:hypothetical protein